MSRLEEIRERLKAATKGPWHWQMGQGCTGWKALNTDRQTEQGDIIRVLYVRNDGLAGMRYRDADMIAHAPQDIAYLLQENEALRKVVEAARYAIISAVECNHPDECGGVHFLSRRVRDRDIEEALAALDSGAK